VIRSTNLMGSSDVALNTVANNIDPNMWSVVDKFGDSSIHCGR